MTKEPRVDDLDRADHDPQPQALEDGEMVRRWTAAGMLAAERSFRRVKGCTDMALLVAALARHGEE